MCSARACWSRSRSECLVSGLVCLRSGCLTLNNRLRHGSDSIRTGLRLRHGSQAELVMNVSNSARLDSIQHSRSGLIDVVDSNATGLIDVVDSGSSSTGLDPAPTGPSSISNGDLSRGELTQPDHTHEMYRVLRLISASARLSDLSKRPASLVLVWLSEPPLRPELREFPAKTLDARPSRPVVEC